MKRSPLVGAALAVVAALLFTGCANVKPAGSLGYAVNGDTRLRPIPTNYKHVPPNLEPRGPVQFQFGF